MRDVLAARTLELVDVPSESFHEQAAAELVAAVVPLPLVYRSGETLLFGAPRRDRPLVVLAGHLDTVPAQGNVPGRITDGAVHGLGASDMKGGVAVMIELARWAATAEPELDLAFLFFPREEVALEHSPLPELFATGLLDDAALVVVLEPTDGALHAGCLGNAVARISFRGESAHAARPWLGVNAIELALDGLRAVAAVEPLDVEVQGLTFREVLTLVRIQGGIADNVVPDRVTATVNYRFAPGRTPAEAVERLRALAGAAEVEVVHVAPAAHVALDNPLVGRLRTAGDLPVEPKQAWTPVAQFAQHGLDAVNLGPGATRYAHRADELVEIDQLVRTYEALRRFAGG